MIATVTARPMRVLLRNAANNLYAMANHGGNPKHVAEMEMQSAALGELADRFDAEMAYNQPGGQTYGMIKFQKEGALACLARLDAPVSPPVCDDWKYPVQTFESKAGDTKCHCGHLRRFHDFYETNLSMACNVTDCECIDYGRPFHPTQPGGSR